MSKETLGKIIAMLEPFLEKENLSLYDIEMVGGKGPKVVRIYLSKEGGVSHKDCISVSRHLSLLIEMDDLLDGVFTLEVSSPGLTRTLKKPLHYQNSIGALARITFRNSFNGPKVLIGRISEVDGEKFKITDEKNNKIFDVTFDDISKTKLEFEE